MIDPDLKSDLQHESVFKLVKESAQDFSQLGFLRFQIGEIDDRGRPERFALLNEDQCYLLLTYCRNTERTRCESEYEQYFTAPDHKDRPSDLDSLEQPSPLHVIQTKTTYGCSELELIE